MSLRDLLVRFLGKPRSVKLQLACAYIDMGNIAQARTLLEAVAAEGTIEEKKEAEALLARVS